MRNLLLEHVFGETLEYLESMPKTKRKEMGQFFTSMETARYMASMFTAPNKDEWMILDAGAGSGILTAAAIERLQNERVKRIRVVCYETSKDVIPLLKANLTYLKHNSAVLMDFEVREENYITTQSDDFNHTMLANPAPPKYDWIIGNPPYKKISKDAVEAVSMPDVCHGAPNLYFLFASMGLFNLADTGEMVYIIPRSWTSGAYFKRFRDYFLTEGTVRQIHLFVSRDKVFEKESVLQETIIVKVDKSPTKEAVILTSSNSNSDFAHVRAIEMPYDRIVFGAEKYVYLVTTEAELKALNILGRWKNTLPSLGMKMRTGLTVDFRNRDCLKNKPDEGTVPLLYPQHLKDGRVVFPACREFEYVTTEKAGLLQKNKNYLFVKRFTAKEEKRRLQSGIYLSSDLPEYSHISTQNKINFIEGIRFDLSEAMVYGLYALFNSTLYDLYYRILNGSTQVNSTEVNEMPMPELEEIERLGTALMKEHDLTVAACDKLLEVLLHEQTG